MSFIFLAFGSTQNAQKSWKTTLNFVPPTLCIVRQWSQIIFLTAVPQKMKNWIFWRKKIEKAFLFQFKPNYEYFCTCSVLLDFSQNNQCKTESFQQNTSFWKNFGKFWKLTLARKKKVSRWPEILFFSVKNWLLFTGKLFLAS